MNKGFILARVKNVAEADMNDVEYSIIGLYTAKEAVLAAFDGWAKQHNVKDMKGRKVFLEALDLDANEYIDLSSSDPNTWRMAGEYSDAQDENGNLFGLGIACDRKKCHTWNL